MDGSRICKKDFKKPTNLYREVLIKTATAVFDARNRQAELNVETRRSDRRALEIELADLELYYQDMYLHGGSLR